MKINWILFIAGVINVGLGLIYDSGFNIVLGMGCILLAIYEELL